jgi:hypothetical protein
MRRAFKETELLVQRTRLETARSVSEILVHVAAGHGALLDMMGVEAPRGPVRQA